MKYLVCSDIHLGHLKTPTAHIIQSFKKSILTEQNKDIDVLFISGDLFDRLLDLNSKEVQIIVDFFSYLLSYCFSNGIKLRVLEGTPSHDWQQSQLLVKLNDIRPEKVDLRYFKVLDIEYLVEENRYVLYIPDEWTNNHADLEFQIFEKLNELGIKEVDIAILHGQFKYQFHGKPYNGFFFKEEYFLPLVKGFIHVGHYHTFNPFDRILPNGSLERLAHGEEEPKGYIVVKDKSYAFIPNINAFIYTTLNIKPKTTVDKLDKMIRQHPKGSHIRLSLDKDHPFNINFQDLKIRYIDYHIKRKLKEDVSVNGSATYILTDDDLDLGDKFTIDDDISKTVMIIIGNKHELTMPETQKLINYLDVFKDTATTQEV